MKSYELLSAISFTAHEDSGASAQTLESEATMTVNVSWENRFTVVDRE